MNKSPSSRKAALNILSNVTEKKSFCNLELKKYQNQYDNRAYAFISALCYTVLDHLVSIDTIINSYCQKSPKSIIHNILRLGACEILYMNTPTHAAVFEYVSLCRTCGKPALCGFVNGVLRSVCNDKEILLEKWNQCEYRSACPEWLLNMWNNSIGKEETERLISSETIGMTVRAQFPETTEHLYSVLPVSSVKGKMDDHALILSKGFDFTSFPSFIKGEMTVQGEGAMVVCKALGDCSGKTVLDACAAPGGKSAYLASLFQNNLTLSCWELHDHRVNLMKNTFQRLHVNAVVQKQDATCFVPKLESSFDKVLLDVPCSGLGLFHEKPDIRYNKSLEDIASLAEVQKKILDVCCRYVKVGGILVYATCTISPKENEEQIQFFLSEHSEFQPDPLPFDKDKHMVQLLPHIHGTDGFFIARMKRCS